LEEFKMKKFNVTVNGTAYDVEVNEVILQRLLKQLQQQLLKQLLHQLQLQLQQQLQFQQVLKL